MSHGSIRHESGDFHGICVTPWQQGCLPLLRHGGDDLDQLGGALQRVLARHLPLDGIQVDVRTALNAMDELADDLGHGLDARLRRSACCVQLDEVEGVGCRAGGAGAAPRSCLGGRERRKW